MATFLLGTLPSSGAVTTRTSVLETTDTTDVYRFSLGSTSDINLGLRSISSGDDADLTLYRDNGNGFFDSGDAFITSSANSSNQDDSVNVADRSAGTYFAVVNRFASGSSGSVSYTLALSTANPNNILAAERGSLGNITADTTRFGSLSNTNTSDTFSFSIGFFRSVNVSLSGLSADLDLRIIADTNNNRVVDSSDLVLSSTRAGTATDSIFLDDAGSYFVQAYQFGSSSSSYTLTFDQSTTTNA